MTGVRRALAFSFVERYLLLVISLGTGFVIARLLTPEMIGIYSVSMAFVGIAQVLRDFGVASYLIQAPDLTNAHIGTAFGVLLLLGSFVFGGLFVAAPWIAAFYGESQMTLTLRVCAFNFLALPFCTVSLALLRRNMEFKTLVWVNSAAALAGSSVTVGLAYLGYGVVSLAIGSVISAVVTGICAWIARDERRIVRPTLSKWRSVVNFGAQSSAAGVVTSMSMDVNDLAVGKIMGFESVALLSRAQGLMNIFHRDLMSAVRNVAYPAFAKAAREAREIESLYVASVTNVTAIAWPFYGFVAIYSLDILRIMFGAQWDAAAPLVPVFCLAGSAAATFSLITSVVMAVGRVDLVTKVELFFQPLRAALIIAAAMWFKTTMACAVALVVSFFLYIPCLYFIKGRCLPTNYRLLASGLLRSLWVALAALALPALMAVGAAYWGLSLPRWPQFFLAALICLVSWLAALFWLRHPLSQDSVMVELLNRCGLGRAIS